MTKQKKTSHPNRKAMFKEKKQLGNPPQEQKKKKHPNRKTMFIKLKKLELGNTLHFPEGEALFSESQDTYGLLHKNLSSNFTFPLNPRLLHHYWFLPGCITFENKVTLTGGESFYKEESDKRTDLLILADAIVLFQKILLLKTKATSWKDESFRKENEDLIRDAWDRVNTFFYKQNDDKMIHNDDKMFPMMFPIDDDFTLGSWTRSSVASDAIQDGQRKPPPEIVYQRQQTPETNQQTNQQMSLQNNNEGWLAQMVQEGINNEAKKTGGDISINQLPLENRLGIALMLNENKNVHIRQILLEALESGLMSMTEKYIYDTIKMQTNDSRVVNNTDQFLPLATSLPDTDDRFPLATRLGASLILNAERAPIEEILIDSVKFGLEGNNPQSAMHHLQIYIYNRIKNITNRLG